MAYLPLSTANLPDPVIDPAQDASPEDYFNTVLYTGSGATGKTVTSGFATDFIWLKDRGDADVHQLVDIVRGGNKLLQSNQTDSEYTLSAVDFQSTGVELLTGSGNINGSGDSFVSWHWKANGSGVTNTDGSITSTVSANTTSGFSIVSYTATNVNGTIGHGLTQAPELVICKNRDATASWAVGSDYLTSWAYSVELDTTDAEASVPTRFNSTAPTSSVFSVGTSGFTNANAGNKFIAYCFHSVEGFSKFGSYVGNGSADGPFVYTGFRPAFVITKRTDGLSDWLIMDSSRDTFNGAERRLFADLSDAETSGTVRMDILSNGFKARDTSNFINSSGGTYIYMAFAENPFKYSNAR